MPKRKRKSKKRQENPLKTEENVVSSQYPPQEAKLMNINQLWHWQTLEDVKF